MARGVSVPVMVPVNPNGEGASRHVEHWKRAGMGTPLQNAAAWASRYGSAGAYFDGGGLRKRRRPRYVLFYLEGKTLRRKVLTNFHVMYSTSLTRHSSGVWQ